MEEGPFELAQLTPWERAGSVLCHVVCELRRTVTLPVKVLKKQVLSIKSQVPGTSILQRAGIFWTKNFLDKDFGTLAELLCSKGGSGSF